MRNRATFQAVAVSLILGTGGVGAIADDISRKRRYIYESQVERPATYFPLLNQVLPELQEVVAETSSPNWNGYGALPVTEGSFDKAKQFISMLPGSTPVPIVSAAPNGQITLEWYRAPKQLLSISVSPNGQLHFAALVGNNESYGTRELLDKPPEDITRLISEVMAPNGHGEKSAATSR